MNNIALSDWVAIQSLERLSSIPNCMFSFKKNPKCTDSVRLFSLLPWAKLEDMCESCITNVYLIIVWHIFLCLNIYLITSTLEKNWKNHSMKILGKSIPNYGFAVFYSICQTDFQFFPVSYLDTLTLK